MGGTAIADDGEVAAFPANPGLADIGQVLAFGNLVLVAVKFFVLDEADRIVAPDRALQQTLRG